MKKILAVFMALALSLLSLTACGGDASSSGSSSASGDGSSSSAPVESGDAAAILEAIEAKVPVTDGKEVDADTLSLLMNITLDNVVSYSGKLSQRNQCTDQIIVLQAKPGKVDAVKAELEAQRDAMVASSSNYAEFAGEKVKAENGRVVVHGDYVVLAILGNADAIQADGGVDAVYGPVDEAIDEAFK